MTTSPPRNPRRRFALTALGLIACGAVGMITMPAARTQDQAPVESTGEAPPAAADVTAAEPIAPQAAESVPADELALAEGKALYRGLCSGCHGGAGRGGKGPDLTDDRWIHGDTDRDIARTIQNGVPRTTMKKLGESLTDEQIARIIAYVRSLARAPGGDTWQPYLAGEPELGRQLFFDANSKAQCSKCHSVGNKGGRIGPALDRIASRRSAQHIMESILEPSKDIDPLYEAVQVVTADGRVIKGVRINETNFSIQFREEDGRFHSYTKRDLEGFRVLETSFMPEDQARQLTVKQLHDLFAFLMTLE